MSDRRVRYKIASGKVTRKWKYSLGAGAPSGGGLALVLIYLLGRIDPLMPDEVKALAAGLLAAGLTAAGMALAGWLARPSVADKPVVDHAAGGTGIPDEPPAVRPLTERELHGDIFKDPPARP